MLIDLLSIDYIQSNKYDDIGLNQGFSNFYLMHQIPFLLNINYKIWFTSV